MNSAVVPVPECHNSIIIKKQGCEKTTDDDKSENFAESLGLIHPNIKYMNKTSNNQMKMKITRQFLRDFAQTMSDI